MPLEEYRVHCLVINYTLPRVLFMNNTGQKGVILPFITWLAMDQPKRKSTECIKSRSSSQVIFSTRLGQKFLKSRISLNIIILPFSLYLWNFTFEGN